MDRIQLSGGVPVAIAYGLGQFADTAAALTCAQQLLEQNPSTRDIAILRVDGDTMLFYGPSSGLEAIRLRGIGDPSLITLADFV